MSIPNRKKNASTILSRNKLTATFFNSQLLVKLLREIN